MAKEKNYWVSNNEVHAVVMKLTEKETKEVRKYIDLGFKLVQEQPKVKTKEEKEDEKKNNPYSKVNVEKFLQSLEDKKYWEEYQKRYHEQAGTNRTQKDKATGEIKVIPDEPKVLKSGKPKEKGFANCIGWFKANFTYNKETGTYDKVNK